MKRRWIALGFVVVALALGAWLIFPAKPEGQVSIRFLGYHTNDFNERSVLLWITNGHDFPVECRIPYATNSSDIGTIVNAYKVIEPYSTLSHRCFPEQLVEVPASPWQLEVIARSMRPYTKIEKLRAELGMRLAKRNWESLGRFVDPMHLETVLSEPIPPPPEIKQE